MTLLPEYDPLRMQIASEVLQIANYVWGIANGNRVHFIMVVYLIAELELIE